MQTIHAVSYTVCKSYSLQIIQSADHTVCRPYSLHTQSTNHVACRPYNRKTVLSADHQGYRIHRLQTHWSVISFLGTIGLGISVPASPEKNALVDTLGSESFPTSLSLRLTFQGPSEVLSYLLDNFWERFSNGAVISSPQNKQKTKMVYLPITQGPH